MNFKDFYKILEISKTATTDDVKIAYRQLAKRYHPDSNGGNYNFTELMQDINEAYEILKDPEKRIRYDRQYDQQYNGSTSSGNQQRAKEEAEKQTKAEFFIWTGFNAGYLSKNMLFNDFVESNLKQLIKGEFETTKDFNNLIEIRKKELFNIYLGEQNISMIYDADREIFNVEVYSELHGSTPIKFVIAVAKNIAPKFKAEVKNFHIKFDRDFKIEEIFVSFQQANYKAFDIYKDINWFEIQQKQHHEEELKLKTQTYIVISLFGLLILSLLLK